MRPVMLIEDNADDVLLTLRALRKHKVINEVVVAVDGDEAIRRLFDSDSVLPCLILLDLKLPKISGLEVLDRLRADSRTKFVPVVVLTGSQEYEDIMASYSKGANAYVRKPVEFSEFAEAISILGKFWLLLNKISSP